MYIIQVLRTTTFKKTKLYQILRYYYLIIKIGILKTTTTTIEQPQTLAPWLIPIKDYTVAEN